MKVKPFEFVSEMEFYQDSEVINFLVFPLDGVGQDSLNASVLMDSLR